MSSIKQGFARIVESRDRMLEVRNARFDTLQRFRTFAKERLAEFVSTTDPVTGQRLADVSAGGEKARGEMAMALAFFEGSRLRFDVDATAQYAISANPPELISHIGRLVDLIVPEDCSSATLVYEAAGDAAKEPRTLDASQLIEKLVEYAVAACDEQLGDAGRSPGTAHPARPQAAPAGQPPARAELAATLSGGSGVTSRQDATADGKPVFSFSIG